MKCKLYRVISPLAGGKEGTLTFPPISLGILTRYIRDHGFDMDQDDLHRRWYSTASKSDTQRLRHVAEDEKRMWKYLEEGDDGDWEWFGEKATGLSDFAEPDVFLFSMISSDLGCCVATLAFASYLKKRFGKPIILGGEYFAYAPIYDEIERVLSLGAIDYYVIGYGEEPLERLLKIMTGQGYEDTLAAVPGLCYIDDGQVRKNPFTPYHPLVPPDFDGLPINLYRWSPDFPPPDPKLPTPKDELTLPFHTSTGCPYNCSFCECSGMKKMSFLSPEKSVEELKRLVDRYGCRTFFFLDNTLNFSHRHINELCDRIIKARLDIQWTDCASFHEMDMKTLKKMREAGLIRIVWGLESGSNRILKYLKKPVRVENASEFLVMAHEVGIWNGVEIIVGMPTETEEEFEETMKFLEAHASVLDEVWTYQFYLNSNSDMLMNHDRYGITNVRRVNVGLMKDAVYAAVAATHIFDEKDGYNWMEKDEQQKRRLAIMVEHVAKLRLYPMTWEHEQQPNLLSWCYRQCQTKAGVRALYRHYWEKLSLRRTWGPSSRRGDSVEELAEEIYQEFKDHDPHPGLEEIWRSVYPDKWSPFFPDAEVTPDLSYERRLLIDGRFHDKLVYSRLKERLRGDYRKVSLSPFDSSEER
jgi:hypothetical protein